MLVPCRAFVRSMLSIKLCPSPLGSLSHVKVKVSKWVENQDGNSHNILWYLCVCKGYIIHRVMNHTKWKGSVYSATSRNQPLHYCSDLR